MSRNYYSKGTPKPVGDVTKLPKWAQRRLNAAENTAEANRSYWEKQVDEATRGRGPYTFIMETPTNERMPREIRCRMVGDSIEIMSSYGGALRINPQVTNVIHVSVEER